MSSIVQMVDMLGLVSPKPPPGLEAELGVGIAGGELPHAQACVLYILRTGVVEQLSETGQRLLLEKCFLLPKLRNSILSSCGSLSFTLLVHLCNTLLRGKHCQTSYCCAATDRMWW